MKRVLCIATTTHRANELRKKFNNAKVTTLTNLINELFEIYSDKAVLDDLVATTIIYNLIKDNKIEYFDYLEANDTSLEIIYDYFVKLGLNDVKIEDFKYKKAKREALQELYKLYQEYKKTHNFADLSDMVDVAIANIDKYLAQFSEVYKDNFEINGLKLYHSKKEKIFLDKIKANTLNLTTTCTPTLYHHKVFDSLDEVRIAIKIAKKLLLEGNKCEDIVIATSDFNEYAPYYEILADEYGIKLYDTMGVSLATYSTTPTTLYHHKNENVQKAYFEYQTKLKALNATLDELGLKNDKLASTLLANTKVRKEKEGILFIDTNKLLGLDKKYKHIIFIGTDITHFPPELKDNFLFTAKDAYEKFNTNNVFTASKVLYDELKRISENLYIITSTYQDKRKLTPSIIIDKNITNKLDISDIKSKYDIIKSNKVISDKNEFEKSISSDEYSAFDGLLGGEFDNGNSLSASAINTYVKCPLQYYFRYVLGLNKPQNDEEGFDSAGRGSLMHKCFEMFVNEMKQNPIQADEKNQVDLYKLMLTISQEAFESDEIKKIIGYDKDGNLKLNIYHKIELKNLQKGLTNPDETKQELAKFVDYYIKHKFNDFQTSLPEEEFMLDIDLKPTTDENERFIKGFIDRLDELGEEINIIDYKSSLSSYSKKDFLFKDGKLKNYQLGLYMLYAKQAYPNKKYNSHLISFKKEKPQIIALNDKEYNDEYEQNLKQGIFEIRDNINSGKFCFDNSDCEWCDYKHICFYNELNKGGDDE